MKVSIAWLKSLVDLKVSPEKLVRLINLRTIGTKEVTSDFIELDMKGYNRADLLSLRGVAYEVSAITDSTLKFTEPDEKKFIWATQNLSSTPVSTDKNLCSIQAVAKIEGLKVKQSDKPWIKKLANSGMRSVNNIADVTNLVMLEYGHPLHAFDQASVKDDTINVRAAVDEEEITTLDGKLRRLTTEDIVLADTEKALDVAGVMGGKETEITDTTNTILLSASLFNPIMIRKTSQRLGLSSEASKRFYHGLTKKRLFQALDAAIRLYQSLGGKLTALTIVDNSNHVSLKISLKAEKLNSLIGIEIKPEQVEEYLTRLNFKVTKVETGWEVIPPYYRLDISEEVDVIEEIARIYGYENIPSIPLQGEIPTVIDQKLFQLIQNLTTKLNDQGLDEILTYSFYSTNILNNLGFDKSQLIKVKNPISSETEYLRDAIWPNLLEKVVENLKYFDSVAVFEVGKVYKPKLNHLPKEDYKLSSSLSNSNQDNIVELKQRVEQGLKQVGFKIEFESHKPGGKLFHPQGFWQVLLNNQVIGFLAQIHPRISDKMGSSNRVSVFEINLANF